MWDVGVVVVVVVVCDSYGANYLNKDVKDWSGARLSKPVGMRLMMS